jgi:hypothetical protein
MDAVGVVGLLVALLGLGADNTPIMLATFLIGVLLLSIAAWPHRELGVAGRIAVITGIFITFAALAYSVDDANYKRELQADHGTLVPAGDTVIGGHCEAEILADIAYLKDKSFGPSFTKADQEHLEKLRRYPRFVWGGLTVSVDRSPTTIVSIKGKPVLQVFLDQNERLQLSVNLFDKDGHQLVNIDRNHFDWIGQAAHERRPDRSTIVIDDDLGNEVLRIRFNNDRQFSIDGKMYFDGLPLSVGEGSITYGTSQLGTGCSDGGNIYTFG